MTELAGISQGYEYQHNATKNRKSNIRNPRKFNIRDTFWTDHLCLALALLGNWRWTVFWRSSYIIQNARTHFQMRCIYTLLDCLLMWWCLVVSWCVGACWDYRSFTTHVLLLVFWQTQTSRMTNSVDKYLLPLRKRGCNGTRGLFAFRRTCGRIKCIRRHRFRQ